MAERFTDRSDAGKRLAGAFSDYAGSRDLVVFGLPRGGVPVAFEVARHLGAPLDIVVVRKIGVPGQPELAMGAVASGGVIVRNEQVLGLLKMSDEAFNAAAAAARTELKERELALRGDERDIDITGKTAIVVDDGMATGSSMKAAVEALRTLGPRSIVVAVPVAAPEVVARLEWVADDVVSLLTPLSLVAVGAWYRQFGQTPESEVRRLLDKAIPDL